MRKQETEKPKIQKILGRICKDEERLFFAVGKQGATRVPLSGVLSVIAQNPSSSNEQIVGEISIKGIKPTDIETARLYLHRFGADLSRPAPLPRESDRVLLLDECTPTSAALPLTRIFGWATHVELEGLAGRGTPDQNIWKLAVQESFPVIVTRDSDFLAISEYLGEGIRSPFLVHIMDNISTASLCALFDTHKDDIRQMMRAGEAVRGCSLGVEKGCHPII